LTNIEFAALTKLGIRNIIYKTAPNEVVITAFDSAIKGENFYLDEIAGLPVYHRQRAKPNTESQQQLTTSEFELAWFMGNKNC